VVLDALEVSFVFCWISRPSCANSIERDRRRPLLDGRSFELIGFTDGLIVILNR